MKTQLPVTNSIKYFKIRAYSHVVRYRRVEIDLSAFILKPRSFLRVSSIPGRAADRLQTGGVQSRMHGTLQVQSAAMRLRVAGAVLLSAAAYYVYVPLPSGVSEPWKLMLLDALFRSFMQAVRAAGCMTGQSCRMHDRTAQPGTGSCQGGGNRVRKKRKNTENTRKTEKIQEKQSI